MLNISTKMQISVNVGNQLYRLRTEHNDTQEAIARLLHVSTAMMDFYETGRIKLTVDRLWQLAHRYSKNINYFYEGLDVRVPFETTEARLSYEINWFGYVVPTVWINGNIARRLRYIRSKRKETLRDFGKCLPISTGYQRIHLLEHNLGEMTSIELWLISQWCIVTPRYFLYDVESRHDLGIYNLIDEKPVEI